MKTIEKAEAKPAATSPAARKQVTVRPGSELAGALIEAQSQSITARTAESAKKAEQIRVRNLGDCAQDYCLPDGTILATDDLRDGKAIVDFEKLQKDFPAAFKACVSPGAPFLTMLFKPAMMLLAGSHAAALAKKKTG